MTVRWKVIYLVAAEVNVSLNALSWDVCSEMRHGSCHALTQRGTTWATHEKRRKG